MAFPDVFIYNPEYDEWHEGRLLLVGKLVYLACPLGDDIPKTREGLPPDVAQDLTECVDIEECSREVVRLSQLWKDKNAKTK